jgi:hypothetical protein
MYGSFESSQYIEVIGPGDESRMATFQLTLICTSRGCVAQLSGPPENCYQAEAAEFELDSIHVLDGEGKPHLISEEILEAIAGKKLAQKMYEAAELEAIESGEF